MNAAVRIFLCYAREDEEQVENLYRKLSAAGLNPWMDKKDILPGEIWESSIRRAIRGSGFFLACLSAKSVKKRSFIQKEILGNLVQYDERQLKDSEPLRKSIADKADNVLDNFEAFGLNS